LRRPDRGAEEAALVRRKGLTSVELAKLAGVSSATISRAFSADSSIKPKTRERILALADEHGFRPNAMARSLNNSQSRLVALVVNTVANPAEGEGLDQLIHHLQARERMPLLLCCANHEDRSQLMRIASTYQVDHVVLCSDAVSIDDAPSTSSARRSWSSRRRSRSTGANVSDVRLDAGAATKLRSSTGWSSAGAAALRLPVRARSSSHIDKQRMGWFSQPRSEAHGLAFDVVEHGDYSYESGYKEAALLLRRSAARRARLRQRPDGRSASRTRPPSSASACPRTSPSSGMTGWPLAGWDSPTRSPRSRRLPGEVSAALAAIIDLEVRAEPPVQRVVDCVVRNGAAVPAKFHAGARASPVADY
jgi:transcriptional regulator with XRE-family HTH domain